MRSDDIATLMTEGMAPPAGNSDLGFHQGVIESWDDNTGANSVSVNGASLTNLRSLQGGIATAYTAGDVVALLRFQQSYFILGKIAAPGATAASRVSSQRIAVRHEVTTGIFTDLLSTGPRVTVYIGKARRALVIHSCEIVVSGIIDVAQFGEVHQGVRISGATNAQPQTLVTNAYFKGAAGHASSVTATTLLEGMNEGSTTFTCQYRGNRSTAGQRLAVNNRVLTVIPL